MGRVLLAVYPSISQVSGRKQGPPKNPRKHLSFMDFFAKQTTSIASRLGCTKDPIQVEFYFSYLDENAQCWMKNMAEEFQYGQTGTNLWHSGGNGQQQWNSSMKMIMAQWILMDWKWRFIIMVHPSMHTPSWFVARDVVAPIFWATKSWFSLWLSRAAFEKHDRDLNDPFPPIFSLNNQTQYHAQCLAVLYPNLIE